MSEPKFSPSTQVAIEVAQKAGTILKEGFGTTFAIDSKEGKHNLVTEYDHLCEKKIIGWIQEKYPTHCFLSEECGAIEAECKEAEWVIDPLDGTVNFAHNVPMFSVSIGMRKNKEIILGVVYQPITEELFVAEKGKGAYLNGKKLEVTPTKKISDSFLSTGFPYNFGENPHHCIEKFMKILKQGIPIRRIGVASLDLAYLAAGRFDGFFEASLAPWDCAAGVLIIEEAKGKVSTWDDTPFSIDSYQPIMATNGKIHEELARILQEKSI